MWGLVPVSPPDLLQGGVQRQCTPLVCPRDPPKLAFLSRPLPEAILPNCCEHSSSGQHSLWDKQRAWCSQRVADPADALDLGGPGPVALLLPVLPAVTPWQLLLLTSPPPQGAGPGHRCHCSPRGQSADLHHEWLPLGQGEGAPDFL